VSFWVSALGGVLDAVDAASRAAGVVPAVSGPAGAGAVHLTLGPDTPPDAAARLVGALRGTLTRARGSVVVLAAPAAVRAELNGGYGGMAGAVPSLRLMRAVKDQFDPDSRMSPGRFPEGI
jgi:glycolate oxidase FAD binding subunit